MRKLRDPKKPEVAPKPGKPTPVVLPPPDILPHIRWDEREQLTRCLLCGALTDPNPSIFEHMSFVWDHHACAPSRVTA